MSIAGIELGGFDVVVFIIVGFSAILSFARGLSREVISILALLIGLAGALFVFGRFQIEAQGFIKPIWLADAALFCGVFGLLYLGVSFILRGWAKDIRGKTPGMLDRFLGLGFGVFRGTLLAALFVLVISTKEGSAPEWMNSAKSYPTLRTVADKLETLPFAKIKDIKEEIIETGKDSDILRLDENQDPEKEP